MSHHTLIGFCHWDLPALIILLIVIAVLILRIRKMKKRKEELEDMLEEATQHSEFTADAAGMTVPLGGNAGSVAEIISKAEK